MRVVVLATYYSMLLDDSTLYVLAMTESQEGVLLDICKDIRKSKKPQSLVVKLSVHIPCKLFRAATPHDETIIASASRRSDSGIEDMEEDGTKNAANAQPFNGDHVRSSSVRVTCNDTFRPTDHTATTDYKRIVVPYFPIQRIVQRRVTNRSKARAVSAKIGSSPRAYRGT
jgi:hypothetical protein